MRKNHLLTREDAEQITTLQNFIKEERGLDDLLEGFFVMLFHGEDLPKADCFEEALPRTPRELKEYSGDWAFYSERDVTDAKKAIVCCMEDQKQLDSLTLTGALVAKTYSESGRRAFVWRQIQQRTTVAQVINPTPRSIYLNKEQQEGEGC